MRLPSSLMRWSASLDVAADSSLCSMVLKQQRSSASHRVGGGGAGGALVMLSVFEGGSVSPENRGSRSSKLETGAFRAKSAGREAVCFVADGWLCAGGTGRVLSFPHLCHRGRGGRG